jgi:hypothetical protein
VPSSELEDWLSDESDVVIGKRAAGATLLPREQLFYEIWLLYIQARNGGLSQYFCNYGSEQWQRCVSAARAGGITSFHPFASGVNEMIAGARDPYKALIKRGAAADDLYYEYEATIVAELRAKYSTVT